MPQVEYTHCADLRPFNSFGVTARAQYLVRAWSMDGLLAALDFAQRRELPVEVLGGGSNVLIVDDLNAVVILPQLRGIT